MPKVRTRTMNSSWLRQREIGQKLPLGYADRFSRRLYSAIVPCTSWDHGENLRNAMHGGVFNLEFSPDGSLLVAACEKKSILMFDPLCRKLIHAVDNAHRDCVNCVRFLDSRMFATCSDDSTVALWDARNLKSQIRTLHGHSNWVKNIEYSPRDSLLVTSGFDGSIYTWDINSYTENGFLYNRVFHTNGLMRTRLNPDASKMIVCTTGGYLIIIHNLNLTTMAQDLAGFKPNMYRLMQLSQTTIPVAANFSHLFSPLRQKNRVEFVSDFPVGDDAEVVSSLQIHPQGWCALSRNISNDENSEWTCVHDIQARQYTESEDPDATCPADGCEEDSGHERRMPSSLVIGSNSRARVVRPLVDVRMHSTGGSGSGASEEQPRRRGTVGDFAHREDIVHRGFSPANVELHVSSADVWEALVAIREARLRRERERERAEEEEERPQALVRIVVRRNGRSEEEVVPSLATTNVGRVGGNATASASPASDASSTAAGSTRVGTCAPPRSQEPSRQSADATGGPSTEASNTAGRNRSLLFVENATGEGARSNPAHLRMSAGSTRIRLSAHPPSSVYRLSSGSGHHMYEIQRNYRIHQNVERLTHYVEEPNVGKGFIKELCFSADGRLICSPFGYGVRLLAFSPECSELATCVPVNPPTELCTVTTNVCHPDIVVSTKFSPQHCLLVSGCLSGKIVWHQPVV